MVLGLSYLRSPRALTATGLTFTLACSFAIKESTYLFGLLLAVFMLIILAAQFDAQNRVAAGTEADANKLNPAFVSATLVFASAGLTVVAVIGHLSGELFPLVAIYMAALAAFVLATALPRIRGRQTDPDYEWPSLINAITAIGWRGWSVALGVFAVSWLLFFTVWFREPGDWATGFTRAIEYWDSQQEVNRGGQPWYYYLYALPIYEWMFVVLAFIGGWRGLRKPTIMTVLMVWFAVRKPDSVQLRRRTYAMAYRPSFASYPDPGSAWGAASVATSQPGRHACGRCCPGTGVVVHYGHVDSCQLLEWGR